MSTVTAKVMSGRSHFSWAGLELLSGLPVLHAHTFASNGQLPFLNQRREKQKYVAKRGIESSTSCVRRAIDCSPVQSIEA